MNSVTTWFLDGPKTARLEGKITRTLGVKVRRISRRRRVESMLTRRPRSRFASAVPLTVREISIFLRCKYYGGMGRLYESSSLERCF